MAEIKKVTNAPETTVPAKRPNKTALEYLQGSAFRAQLENALPKHLGVDRFVRSAMNEFRLNPTLQQCSVPSVLGFFMQAAMTGLEPGAVLGQCYAVPFRNKKTGQMEAQFIIGYRGMLSIARRSGEVLSVDAQIVHEKDDFELWYGIEQKLVHKPYIDGNPGEMRGAYCVVRFRDGSYQYKFMPKYEIDQHRARSKASSSGPWVTDYLEMCKKSVFRSMFKWLPISIEQVEQVAADEATVNYKGETAKPDDDIIEISFASEGEEVIDIEET